MDAIWRTNEDLERQAHKSNSCREMVSKLCRRCVPGSSGSPDRVQRHHFYLCQWQTNTQVGICYLLYRLLVAITFLAVCICSALDIGRSGQVHSESHYWKWWIYLTNWALFACTVQGWLAALIVTKGLMVDRNEFEWNIQMNRDSLLNSVYWVIYTIATVYSFVVSFVYWCFVYDPEIHSMDMVNIMVHGLTSVVMFIDLTIVGHPIKLSHAYWTTALGVIYFIFSLIYYLGDGTDRNNLHTIYANLDWARPGKAIVISAASVLVIFLVHFLCYCIYCLRVWLYTKICVRSTDDNSEKISAITKTLSSLEEHQRDHFLNPSTIIDLK